MVDELFQSTIARRTAALFVGWKAVFVKQAPRFARSVAIPRDVRQLEDLDADPAHAPRNESPEAQSIRAMRRKATVERQQLRREATLAQRILWQRLRRHGLGVKFRRTSTELWFNVDFWCPSARLAIVVRDNELGEVTLDQADLQLHGVRLLVFTDDQVCDDMPSVISAIRKKLMDAM